MTNIPSDMSLLTQANWSRHLPEISDEEAFDKVDDSKFNDQNDSEPE